MTALLPDSPTQRAMLLAVLAATLGAVAGWALAGPVYRAEGLLAAAPASATDTVFPPCPWRGNPPDFVATALAGSRRVTLFALESPTWRSTGEDAGQDAAADFEARRQILPLTQSPHVLVTFDHARPEVALAGVRALLETAERLAAELHAQAEAKAQLAAEPGASEGPRAGAACLRVEDRGVLPTAPFRDTRTSSVAVGAGAGWWLGLLLASTPRRRGRESEA